MSAAPIDRRTLLRGGAAALLGLGATGVLAACGEDARESGPEALAVARRSIAIDYASYYAPIADLRRLAGQRARARGAAITFSADAAAASAQLATLRRWTGPRGGFHALVVAPFDAAAVAPIADAALKRGVKIVSLGASLPHETAHIGIDADRAGRLLARDAARWAQRTLGGGAQVLLVRPPAHPAVPGPFASLAPRAERALLDELAQRAPALDAVAATEGQGSADTQAAVARALRNYPHVRVVLCWGDAAASGAARALARHAPTSEHARLYVGGIAVPGIATRATLATLRSGGILRGLVAPRLRDVADALVDLPYGLLHGRAPHDVSVPLQALSAATPQPIAAYASDYAGS